MLKVDKAYIVSCVNSRVSDIAAAAEVLHSMMCLSLPCYATLCYASCYICTEVLRGRTVADGVELYIAAASSEVEAESARRGDWQARRTAPSSSFSGAARPPGRFAAPR